MKNIYLIITYTGTLPAKLIKLYTKNEYSHISISLDKELNEMYSFARKNPYNFLNAGMIQEYINQGTYKRFYNTKCIVYSYEISNEKYELIKKKIYEMYDNKEEYKYDILGLLIAGLNIKFSRDRYFYCTKFVKYLFEEANVNANLPEIPRTSDFQKIDGLKETYKGYLRDYKI